VRKHLTFPRRRLVKLFTSSLRPDPSLDDCVESLGSERRIVTKVEVDVALERAIGVPSKGRVRIRVLHFDRKIPVLRQRRSLGW